MCFEIIEAFTKSLQFVEDEYIFERALEQVNEQELNKIMREGVV